MVTKPTPYTAKLAVDAAGKERTEAISMAMTAPIPIAKPVTWMTSSAIRSRGVSGVFMTEHPAYGSLRRTTGASKWVSVEPPDLIWDPFQTSHKPDTADFQSSREVGQCRRAKRHP